MEIKSYEDDELEELYQLWRNVARERPNALDMNIQEFENANLKSELGEVHCFMAYEENELIGASILLMRPGDANSSLDFLVLEEDLRNETSKELLERSLEFCRDEVGSKVQLSPNIYSDGFVDFMKEQGFEKDEDYPSGLWMKK
ncbi:MAG: hypothetical protein V5A76_08115, partial [Candidatus Thermoplasmatota archaeon]